MKLWQGRLIIAGGRNHKPSAEEAKAVVRILEEHEVKEIVHGGATGVDAWAGRLAHTFNLKETVFIPDWQKLGRAAGPLRNRDMACYADACCLLEGGRGTDSMRREAERAGIAILYDYKKGA